MTGKRERALESFDAYNKADPNAFTWEGQTYPQEYFLALKLHEWVLRLAPDASEALVLASRSQHIGRWEMPRSTYPEGRIGYLTWRKDLMRHHAQISGRLMDAAGFDTDTIDRVSTIILKQHIKKDPDVQTMENALCLVFLQYQYEAFHHTNSAKIVDILAKSLMKMDAAGHAAALSLPFSPQGFAYIEQALAILKNDTSDDS